MSNINYSPPPGGAGADFEVVLTAISILATVPAGAGQCIYCDVTPGSLIVTLPANADEKIYTIKLWPPSLGNTVTIVVEGGGIIEFAASVVLTTENESVMVQCVVSGLYMIISDYDPAAAGGGTLQTVTTAGNTTTLPIKTAGYAATGTVATAINYAVTVNDYNIDCDISAGDIIVTLPTGAAANGCIFVIKLTRVNGSFPAIARRVLLSGTSIDGAAVRVLSVRNESCTVKCISNTGDYIVVSPNFRLNKGLHTAAGFTGAGFIITHGLRDTPDSVWIEPNSAQAGAALQGGYSIAVNSTTLAVTLTVPVVAPISLLVWWGATAV